MPKVIRIYVRYIDAVSKTVGKFSMYLVVVLGCVLLFDAIAITFFNRPQI